MRGKRSGSLIEPCSATDRRSPERRSGIGPPGAAEARSAAAEGSCGRARGPHGYMSARAAGIYESVEMPPALGYMPNIALIPAETTLSRIF